MECSKKCMYCECVIDDVSYSAVEHIKPKHLFEELVLDWDNLGLACSRCNTNKGRYWTDDVDLQLLNPYRDSLDAHITFRGPLTVAHLHSTRGANTIRKLKLSSREDLLLSRMRRIEELDVRLRLWHGESEIEKKDLFAEDVRDAVSKDCEFSGVLRAYAIESGFPIE
ncbi:HNH endonuclease [Rhodococcus oxybenzonivorans]